MHYQRHWQREISAAVVRLVQVEEIFARSIRSTQLAGRRSNDGNRGVMGAPPVRVPSENALEMRRHGMERDVVCGMQVDPVKAAGTSSHNGKTYYFCSKSCKAKFDANPSQYAK